MKLTKEEKDILDSVERGEWKRIPDFKQESARYKQAARATLRKDKRVNIRMTERDLIHFKRLPYTKDSLTRPSFPASSTNTLTVGSSKRLGNGTTE